MSHRITPRGGRDRGASAVEYALLAGLIAAVIAATVLAFGQAVSALFTIPAGVL